ncbi:LysR family transcriptional regulator [Variovorax sp. M-6]|uniref:LysR family transcriptional regulator n=1 Tax=Variovorax sp. M-6 TaxID=3233041 RepID=UPI003F9D3452
MPPAKSKPNTPGNTDRIELLQTFVHIVEAGSLSAAAAQMGATQPTVSRRLQALERFLGLRLLRRSTHAMKLTEDGERCFERAKEILANWQAFDADLRGVDNEPEGTLRVVVPHAFGQDLLVGPLADYLRQHPRVSVEWLLHDRRPDFVAEGIDCAIHVGEVSDPSVVAQKLSEVPRIAVASPSMIAGKATPTHAAMLADLPWLALRTYYRTDIVLAHSRSGEALRLPISPRISTDSLYALRSAALRGLGVCVGSSWLFADDLAQGRLVQLVPDWQASPLPVYLTYPHARFYPAKLRRFLETMRTAVPAAISAGQAPQHAAR